MGVYPVDGGKLAVGCRTHPPFVRPEQLPDGKVVTKFEDPLTFCAIREVYPGSFSHAGAQEAVVFFDQCKDDSGDWDMAQPGSAVLVARNGSRWTPIGYQSAVNLNGCLLHHRTDGRDLLLCQDNWGTSGDVAFRWFFSLDFGAPEGQRQRRLGTVFFDDHDYPCGPNGQESFVEYGVVSVAVKGFFKKDIQKDGKEDLVVLLERASVPFAASLRPRITRFCVPGKDSVPANEYLPRPTLFTLEFLGDGSNFSPSPATQKLLDAWKAEVPDGVFDIIEKR